MSVPAPGFGAARPPAMDRPPGASLIVRVRKRWVKEFLGLLWLTQGISSSSAHHHFISPHQMKGLLTSNSRSIASLGSCLGMDHTNTMDADEWGIEEAGMVPVGDDWQGGQWQTPQTLIDFEEFPTPNHHHLIPDPT